MDTINKTPHCIPFWKRTGTSKEKWLRAFLLYIGNMLEFQGSGAHMGGINGANRDMRHNWNPEAFDGISMESSTHTFWWAGPAWFQVLQPSSKVTWPRPPPHLLAQSQWISQNKPNVRWDWNSELCVGQAMEPNASWLYLPLLLALFSRSTALHVCWVYALSCLLCPRPFLETHPALLKNWGAPFSCLSTS